MRSLGHQPDTWSRRQRFVAIDAGIGCSGFRPQIGGKTWPISRLTSRDELSRDTDLSHIGTPGRRTVCRRTVYRGCAVRCPMEVTVEDCRATWLRATPTTRCGATRRVRRDRRWRRTSASRVAGTSTIQSARRATRSSTSDAGRAAAAMEPPAGGDAKFFSDAMVAVSRAIPEADPAHYVRGQYDGYLDIDGVAAGSSTETDAALRLSIDNCRWSGAPVFVRTGKRLPVTHTEARLGCGTTSGDDRARVGSARREPAAVSRAFPDRLPDRDSR